MRAPGDLKKEIELRLKKYLSRDQTGVRRAILEMFMKARSLTVAEIYAQLQARFSLTYHSVASMVGIIASRIGILHVRRSPDTATSSYELKQQYIDIVARVTGDA
ncbi:MAG: DUF2551 domain-containing protein [Methanomicrobiaceae archaeon]|nr:DUF2551 domain-containing protein [Methanomicrobiaceae archaeon]